MQENQSLAIVLLTSVYKLSDIILGQDWSTLAARVYPPFCWMNWLRLGSPPDR